MVNLVGSLRGPRVDPQLCKPDKNIFTYWLTITWLRPLRSNVLGLWPGIFTVKNSSGILKKGVKATLVQISMKETKPRTFNRRRSPSKACKKGKGSGFCGYDRCLGKVDTPTKSQSKEAPSQTHGGDPRKQNHLLHASVSLLFHFLCPFGTWSFAKLILLLHSNVST